MKIKRISLIFLSLCLLVCSAFIVANVDKKTDNTLYASTREELVEAGQARAEYVYQYRWKPTQTLTGWGTTFTAGNEYAIPYSQPYYYGGYVFYNITLTQYEEYAASGSNSFYSYHDNNGTTRACPRYGLDCSAFVSFCIGSKTRYTTWTFMEHANNQTNGFYNKSFDTATRGDILNCHINNGRQHVLLIKEVNGDNITTYESTPGYSVGNRDIWVRTQTKAQWAADGYTVLGHDYVSNCGGSPKDDVTGIRTTDSIVTLKDNNVLGSTSTNASATSWDLTKAYDMSNANFNSRKAVLSSFSGDNSLYFNQSNSTNIKVGATFKATGKAETELFGKFGIGFFTSAGKGLFTYIDAEGTTGTSTSNITGTNVAVVKKDISGSEGWDWKTSTNFNIAENVYSVSSPITIEIERRGVRFDIYVNGSFAKTISGLNYDIEPDEKIYPSIISFNTLLEVTNYYSTATHNSITIDGDLSDWESLSNWSTISANKKSALDTLTNKGVTFYDRWTREGLFIYGIAKHQQTSTGVEDWWKNTNFEFFINGNENSNQYFAIHNRVQGFDSFYFKTSGSSGNYTSVFEGFIYNKTSFSDGIDIGYAFKVDNESGIADKITQSGGSATSYWCPENTDPRNTPHTLTQEYLRDQASAYEMAGTTGISKDGTTMILDGFTGVRDFYFNEFEDSVVNTFSATFTVTGMADGATNAKIGLSYLDEYGDGFYFYANAITGNTFGLVRIQDYTYYYDETSTAISSFSNVSWSKGTPFTLTIDRNNTVYKLYINDVLVHTITDSTVYRLQNNQSILPSIRSWYTYAEITDYGMKLDPIDYITLDSDLSDWESLSNWQDIKANAIVAVDDNDANKGFWVYTRLTDNGLLMAVKACHDKDLSGSWGDNWWANTNLQIYIGLSSYENRIYVTEFLDTGFTHSSFATFGTSGNYTTIFEGYLDMETLTHFGAYNGNDLRIGVGFRVNNGATSDTITVDGVTQTFWQANNMHPLLVDNVIAKETVTPTPIVPENSSSSNSTISSTTSTPSSSTSEPISSSNASSSTTTPSSSSTIISSSTAETSSAPTNEDSTKKGCKGSLNTLYILLPLALMAIVIVAKKQKSK